MFYHSIVFALRILGLNAAKEKLEIVIGATPPHESKPPKNLQKNIGSYHIFGKRKFFNPNQMIQKSKNLTDYLFSAIIVAE